MEDNRTDLRVLRTRAAIQHAFQEMICQLEANEINVSELTRRAGIHRKTFYLHYTSIDQLFEETIQNLVHGFDQALEQVPAELPVVETTTMFFTYFSQCGPVADRILCAPSYTDYSNRLFAESMAHNRLKSNPFQAYTDEEQQLINAFIMSSVLNFYRLWVRGHRRIPMATIVPLCCKLLSEGTGGFIPEPAENAGNTRKTRLP